MTNQISVQLSGDAVKNLGSFQRSSGLKKNAAMSWILVETGVPHIRKRGKETRGESVDFDLTEAAASVLRNICNYNRVSEGVVLETYLGRKYK
jgi:hypothetical protein